MVILGIETSCDETSASSLEIKRGKFNVLSHAVSSSVKEHAKHGGIVPEVAARKQMEYMIPILEKALQIGISNFKFSISKQTTHTSTKVAKRQKNRKLKTVDYRLHVDAIAVTTGPGLATSLQVGIDTAKTLAYAWQKPIIPVNHLEGHLLSPLLAGKEFSISNFQFSNKSQKTSSKTHTTKIRFPAIGLIVSGGHTELILMRDFLKYKLIGRTRDDAAGEAFDKVARLLNLGYPGGPIISKLAKSGNPMAFDFPRGMMHSNDFDFSFSGLKTAVLYESRKRKKLTPKLKASFAASFQQAVVDVLVHKTIKAAKAHNAKSILLGGGVTANLSLRRKFEKSVKELPDTTYHLSPITYCGDNASMIALAGYYRYKNKNYIQPSSAKKLKKISAQPNLKIA